MYGAMNRCADMVDPVRQEEEFKSTLQQASELVDVLTNNDAVQNKEPVEHVDFSNRESIKRAMAKHKERSVAGVLRLGLQGVNRMLGERCGLARGESGVVYALPHNYKSGFLNSCVSWIPLYNLPPSDLNGKKPLVILFSLENEAFQNTVWIFRKIYETSNQKSAKGLTDDEIISYAFDMFNEKGWTFIIERYQPSEFGAKEYRERIEYYENSGYSVVFAAIDYLNLAKKGRGENSTSVGTHLLVRELFSFWCNYNKAKGITGMTAHPLNRKAGEIAMSGNTNVVKRFSLEHIADSVDVSREVDLEIFMHKEVNGNGVPYLTFFRGKHRYVDNTPEKHKYVAYRFSKFGIPDDILTEAQFVEDIYAVDVDQRTESNIAAHSDSEVASQADASGNFTLDELLGVAA